jgi:hypothetical protein
MAFKEGREKIRFYEFDPLLGSLEIILEALSFLMEKI